MSSRVCCVCVGRRVASYLGFDFISLSCIIHYVPQRRWKLFFFIWFLILECAEKRCSGVHYRVSFSILFYRCLLLIDFVTVFPLTSSLGPYCSPFRRADKIGWWPTNQLPLRNQPGKEWNSDQWEPLAHQRKSTPGVALEKLTVSRWECVTLCHFFYSFRWCIFFWGPWVRWKWERKKEEPAEESEMTGTSLLLLRSTVSPMFQNVTDVFIMATAFLPSFFRFVWMLSSMSESLVILRNSFHFNECYRVLASKIYWVA